jgi:protein gp37
MAETTKIEWTEATWNPITGCSVISPGCQRCYAMKLAGSRLQHIPSRVGLTVQTKSGPVWNGNIRMNWEWLDKPTRWKRGQKIFVCAHGDLFHRGVSEEMLAAIFGVMAKTPRHTFQVLTKRSARLRGVMGGPKHHDLWPPQLWHRSVLPNVWFGVSVEDRERLERIDDLRRTPAAIRFVSFEPLLEDLGDIDLSGIHMAIIGGESGPGHRWMDPDWARSIKRQCESQGVAFFFKQMSGKGEIPADLFVRQWPEEVRGER